MKIEKNDLGIILIKPKQFHDDRGFFCETYSGKKYIDIGINDVFVQDNLSLSTKKGTLRGLHFQKPPYAQAKIVRCGQGSIYDVAVDIRKKSQTFGKWCGYELSAKNGYQLYIPEGFAHGFITLEDNSEIVYKCSNYYHQPSECSLHYNDSEISIDWPNITKHILSEKDKNALSLREIKNPF